MLPLLGDNHCLPLLHTAKKIGLMKKKRINEFAIGYMINPGLHINRSFRDQVEKYMYTTFGEITFF